MTLLYYPQNAPPGLGRLPLSLLALGAVVGKEHEYEILDANVNRRSFDTLCNTLKDATAPNLLAMSVMPGNQLWNAIGDAKNAKRLFPDIPIVWGGYFPSMYCDTVLKSSSVDAVVRGQGELALPSLMNALRNRSTLESVPNLSYRLNGRVRHNHSLPVFDPNDRPMLPYEKVDMDKYAIPTFVGKRTFCHESSVGCPHKCNFCGVVDVFQSRWKSEEPERTREVVQLLKYRYGMDGMEFHDSDFFVSEKRVRTLSELLTDSKIRWWGEGRVDTLLNYDRETWKAMRASGLAMIFFGAESGLDETLRMMDKGGVTANQTRAIAERCREFDVQPEFSFVMGANPTHTEEDIDATIDLSYDLCRINPKTRIHPFVYTPVPFGGIYSEAVEKGFRYPERLEDWANDEWRMHTLRQNPKTPWLTRRLYDKIVNFRAVHHSYHPRLNDKSLEQWKVTLLRLLSAWRYKSRTFAGAYELRILLRVFMNGASREEGF